MNNYFEDIKKVFSENIFVGNVVNITDGLKLLPVFKVNINYLALENIKEGKNNNGTNANISITPICFLQISNNKVELVSFTEKNDFIEKVPNILETLNETFKIGDLFKTSN